MKKTLSLLVVVLIYTATIQAQRKDRASYKEELSIEQQATLAAKKMTLELDLNDAQQRKIQSLLEDQIKMKRKVREDRKKQKESKQSLSADERYNLENERLDHQIDFHRKMKSILTNEQYEKFKKRAKSNKLHKKRAVEKKIMERKKRREFKMREKN